MLHTKPHCHDGSFMNRFTTIVGITVTSLLSIIDEAIENAILKTDYTLIATIGGFQLQEIGGNRFEGQSGTLLIS